jgi:uncharacterized damage-inducible protein DinB
MRTESVRHAGQAVGMTQDPVPNRSERHDLAEQLAQQRTFLRRTVDGLTDAQAASCPTVSQLCLGGIIKHVTATERQWCRFITRGPEAIGGFDPTAMEAHAATFQMRPDETLEGLLSRYDEVAAATGELLGELPSLDVSHPLPVAPWFPPDGRWSARQVLLHIMGETAQHSGHADIIREAIDGAKTMG